LETLELAPGVADVDCTHLIALRFRADSTAADDDAAEDAGDAEDDEDAGAVAP
jgi:hypothetical protein